jgi:hypothetical protein
MAAARVLLVGSSRAAAPMLLLLLLLLVVAGTKGIGKVLAGSRVWPLLLLLLQTRVPLWVLLRCVLLQPAPVGSRGRQREG